MIVKCFLSFVTVVITLHGVLSYQKYFVPDESEYREDGEHIDILIRKRNLRIQKVCMKYNDLHRPENHNVSSLLEWSPYTELPTTGAAERYEIYTTPKMVMCSPRNVAHNALNIFSNKALATFPVPIQSKPKKEIKAAPQKKKKVPKAMAGLTKEVKSIYKKGAIKKGNESDKKVQSKYSGFSKVLLVMHPFLRLAKSYHQMFDSKDQASKELSEMKTTLQKYIKDNQGKVNFEGFVRFIINPWNGADREEVLNLRRQWLPTHYDCEVCHSDLFPNFVYKVDDDNFEDEFMEFLEDFGLEEVKEGEAAEQLIESVNVNDKKTLKKYYAQLEESTLDELVAFYRIDMEMFGYLDMTKF